MVKDLITFARHPFEIYQGFVWIFRAGQVFQVLGLSPPSRLQMSAG